jgi:hypothetical protein
MVRERFLTNKGGVYMSAGATGNINLDFIRDSLGNNNGKVEEAEINIQQEYGNKEKHTLYVVVQQHWQDRKLFSPVKIGNCGFGLTIFSSTDDVKKAFEKEPGDRSHNYLVLEFCGKGGKLKKAFNAGVIIKDEPSKWSDVTLQVQKDIDLDAVMKQRTAWWQQFGYKLPAAEECVKKVPTK